MTNDIAMLGIDIGTTSTKSVIFRTNGSVLASSEISYPTLSPQPAWSEQDPDVILNAVKQSITQAVASSGVSPTSIASAGFSAAMHSLLAVSKEGKPLSKSIIWSDNRSSEQVDTLKATVEAKGFYLRTGTPIHTMSPLAKLLWFKQHSSGLFTQADKFISIKEYVWFHLFGEFVVDHSIASASGLMNLREQQWDQEILHYIGITTDTLSELVPVTYKKVLPSESIAHELGLSPSMPFVIGASDGTLANVGVGAGSSDKTVITIGTSGAVRRTVTEPVTDPNQRTFCYALSDNKWVIGGATNNGGNALRWYRDEWSKGQFATDEMQNKGELYEYLLSLAEKSPAGAQGLLFMPFLNGERAPYWNPSARGAYVGIGNHHTQNDFIRSLLEGVIFSVYSVGIALKELSGPFTEIRASGGFARSPLWLQILADVFNKEIHVPSSYHASAFGAAIISLIATGHLDSFVESDSWTTIDKVYTHQANNHETYQRLHEFYAEIYQSLETPFSKLAAFQKEYTSHLPLK
ncbi:gluconokinase [Alkalicoccobacillus porphyridii]|uniref:Gluconate kinase n=1 Tax=Alkalicoccobacillus porphyridii TaxID=2597270 RepID=A0A554A012_9BACI|nr:gluconokinase [Alkalicoccobacillus porphyridii]TSB47015.1 gluconate kinase [Alkalicoccobacillus porphyridii]